LEEEVVDIEALRDVIDRFGLREAWLTFCGRAGIVDPCEIKSVP
jgi:hypothetical protein